MSGPRKPHRINLGEGHAGRNAGLCRAQQRAASRWHERVSERLAKSRPKADGETIANAMGKNRRARCQQGASQERGVTRYGDRAGRVRGAEPPRKRFRLPPTRLSAILGPDAYQQARQALAGFYAARGAAIWTTAPPQAREAMMAALRAEESAAVYALARDLVARRRTTRRLCREASVEVARRSPVLRRPRRHRHGPRPTFQR